MADDRSSQVAVDLGELRDVAAWLCHEAQSLIGDRDHLEPNVHFGHYSPCGETHLARHAAMSALAKHQTGWDQHQQALASLAATFDKALDGYAETDIDDLRKIEQ